MVIYMRINKSAARFQAKSIAPKQTSNIKIRAISPLLAKQFDASTTSEDNFAKAQKNFLDAGSDFTSALTKATLKFSGVENPDKFLAIEEITAKKDELVSSSKELYENVKKDKLTKEIGNFSYAVYNIFEAPSKDLWNKFILPEGAKIAYAAGELAKSGVAAAAIGVGLILTKGFLDIVYFTGFDGSIQHSGQKKYSLDSLDSLDLDYNQPNLKPKGAESKTQEGNDIC